MKIAVVTPYDASNFGALLQALALKAYLERLGHSVLHVKYRSERSSRDTFYRVRPSKHDLLRPRDYWPNLNFGRRKLAAFKRDQTLLSTIEPSDMSSVDAVVLGSDEIWNIRNGLFEDPIFFGHGMENVIAYAPSVGASTLDDYMCRSERLADIRRLRAVSARDGNTARFVEQVTSRRPPIVLDPTFLHSWGPVNSEASVRLTDPGYLLVYAYNSRHIPVEDLRTLARSRGLRLVSVGFRHDWCDQCVNCSPREFVAVVDGADCVFTTTFHGTIFSILRRKPFVCNPSSPKTVDLLRGLGLGSRITTALAPQGEEKVARVFDRALDYSAVFDVIEGLKSDSHAYLEGALTAVMELRV